jgi:hypothetical protein
MTDIKVVRKAGLALEPDVFELIAADRPDLYYRDKPSVGRIAEVAGIDRKRLHEAARALKNGDEPSLATMGPLVGAYAIVHDVDSKTALAAVLDLVWTSNEAEMERAA